MNFKKIKKRFFSLSRGNGGFTLVELIVVIAILAILGGVAVPAYSGYVEKANMGADQTLVGEVAHALSLYYYKNGGNGGGYVVLTPEGQVCLYDEEGFGNKAMIDAFGEGWENTLSLKYNWNVDYSGSNFAGHEEELVEKVDVLTNALSGAIKENAGEKFTKFMVDNGISVDNAGQAAVLYVAQNTANMTDNQKQAFVNSLSNAISGSDSDLMGAINTGSFGGNDAVSSIAAVYAFAEAYAKYDSSVNASLDTTGIKDVETAGNAVQTFFGEIVSQADQDKLKAYFNEGHAASDAQAYLELMSTVSGAKDVVISNGLENGFSSMTNIFTSYRDGAVVISIDSEGDIDPHTKSILSSE